KKKKSAKYAITSLTLAIAPFALSLRLCFLSSS
ncbi:hypothetical protein JTB14_020164, partial [Gonioctena quinquepunctata]